MKPVMTKAKTEKLFKKHGGILRTTEAIRLGIHCKILYQLRENGDIVQISRGLYRLAKMPDLSDPDIVTVAAKVPHGVLCLISALVFHDITTQIPHKIDIALKRGSITPRLKYPPIRVFRFSGNAFDSGIETHKLDGVVVKVYSTAKTVADCFKFRNKIGLDIALEALKLSLTRRKTSRSEILKYAKICKVEKIIMPYVEAMS